MAKYDKQFFDYVNSGSLASAAEVLPFLYNELSVTSVLDVGCGQGAWLSVWRQLGCTDLKGIDGEYVDRNSLLVDGACFSPHDISKGFQLEAQFDVVQSLEVAEHIPEASARTFISSLVAHGDLVVFSAAPKGQGGHNHVNEQGYEYWRQLFAEHDYKVIDFLRPKMYNNKNIEPWYRYNTFIYVASHRLSTMPQSMMDHLIAENDKLVDISPALYKFRKMIVRIIPTSIQTMLAKCKERVVVCIRSQK
jgi:SAM-dependent methyltransferase